jgi:hypothetical protein
MNNAIVSPRAKAGHASAADAFRSAFERTLARSADPGTARAALRAAAAGAPPPPPRPAGGGGAARRGRLPRGAG